MRTFNLREAAHFLRLHPEELRQRAKARVIPGAKVGRAWVFLEEDLAEYLRSLYGARRQALQVTSTLENKLCHYADAAESGGSTSQAQQASEYDDLLKLPTKASRKNSTIN